MDQEGVLFIVCGPSGVGKTSLCEQLLRNYDRLQFSVSYTTRPPREGEDDGVDYHFVDDTTFDQMQDEGAFAEWADVHGHRYGTAFETLQEAWDEDHDLLFDIDYQGARQLKDHFPGATGVFVVPPSMEALARRLRNRGSESEQAMHRRLKAAGHELEQYELFDYIIQNDEFDRALRALSCVYEAAGHSRSVASNLVEDLLDGDSAAELS